MQRRLTREQLWAIEASDQALQQSGAPTAASSPNAALPWDSASVEVITATGSGPVSAAHEATRMFESKGARAVPLSLAMHGAADAVAALVAQRYRLYGSAHAVSATCASGAIGIGTALQQIRHGYADAVVVIGVEDCLNQINLSSNSNLRALASGYESCPESASRPFDRARSGFVMSAGACALVLEAEENALRRGAEPLAIVAGFGAASDAFHPTAPDPEGRGAARAVEKCLLDAKKHGEKTRVDHINTHGTGTPLGDAAELAALTRVFGAAAQNIPLTATKSTTGHLLGAAGTAEAIISILSLRTGVIPPTINLEDPEFPEWNFVRQHAHKNHSSSILSTSFGFGGHNAAVLFTLP